VRGAGPTWIGALESASVRVGDSTAEGALPREGSPPPNHELKSKDGIQPKKEPACDTSAPKPPPSDDICFLRIFANWADGVASERKERGGERVFCGRAGTGLWCERAGGFRSMARMDVHNCAAQACRERVRMDASAPRASAPRGPHLVERDLSGAVLVCLSDERLDLRRRHLELHQRNDLHQL
jgi:hypothetical protein